MSTTPIDETLLNGNDLSRTSRARLVDGPVAIEVNNLSKTFRIPEHKVDSLKERAVKPLTRAEYKQLHALRDVSFDVHRGEFFGIVGRNGSGKSTLLKILASIYRADGGRVRMAGRVAPFIELGVGFNPEMTAKENVTLNGILFGLTRRESIRMLDSVLDFAEHQELLIRDDGPPRVLDHGSGRCRHHVDRRGTGGRRRVLRPEVHGHLL
jgi:ABC-type multidrug transport system ATPase subunit